MNIAVDHGNSAAKVGIFDDRNLLKKYTFGGGEGLREFLETSGADNIIVSSVKADPERIAGWVVNAKNRLILRPSLPLPVRSLYQSPATLGPDRLASVCGAWQLFPGRNSLVIDAGTCITYDFVDQDGNYHGGAISPGLSMRFEALHTFTAKLPLVSAKAPVPLTGDTTERCIQSGVVNGALAEMNGIIDEYDQKFNHLNVILCGGDTAFFENQMKASIFASPELVLIGLNSILNYNVDKL